MVECIDGRTVDRGKVRSTDSPSTLTAEASSCLG